MPIHIARQTGYVDCVEESLGRHDNHSGIICPILRTMAVGIRSGWAHNIWRKYTMTTRFVIPITTALAFTIFFAACDSKSAPSKACIEAARLYAEALDTDQRAPEGEKAADIKIRKDSLSALEDHKVKLCGE
jgi:hypothetical protein